MGSAKDLSLCMDTLECSKLPHAENLSEKYLRSRVRDTRDLCLNSRDDGEVAVGVSDLLSHGHVWTADHVEFHCIYREVPASGFVMSMQ